MGKGTGLAVLSLLIGAGGLGFGIYIFFTFGAQIADLEGDGGIECDSGRVLETQTVITDSEAVLTDDNTTETQMEDMNISITTYGESYLAMRFFANFYLEIFDQKEVYCTFDVALDFNGEIVSRSRILYRYVESPYPGSTIIDIYYTIPVYLEHITDPLSAGIHNIKVLWWSGGSTATDVRLIASVPSGALKLNRTLIVQEIAYCQLFAPISPYSISP